MFRVKICGITRVEDALLAAEAGADAIGLNFYSASPRLCPLPLARQIASAVGRRVVKVGVFVNAKADEIRRTADAVGLDLVQLHGDEPAELLREIRPLAVMRAFRLGATPPPIGEYLAACHRLMCVPRLVLFDAHAADQFGGTGRVLDQAVVQGLRQQLAGMPLVLAGGLNPQNVAAAVAAVRPWAVDTASGVEAAPGIKAEPLLRAFVAAAADALARIPSEKTAPAQQ